MMKIIGLRVEKYIDKAIRGHNCDFEYYDEEFTRHILCCIEDGQRYEITLWHTEGECGSGRCTASWGHCRVKKVNNFGNYNYIPKSDCYIYDLNEGDYDYVDNDIFSVNYDGGDSYYPSGNYSIDMKLFKKTPRVKEHRPVWIFIGDSNMGKSFIASHTDLSVYETDSCQTLKDVIYDDIIVLGNKYNFSIEDIKNKLVASPEICIVNFLTQQQYENTFSKSLENNLDIIDDGIITLDSDDLDEILDSKGRVN